MGDTGKINASDLSLCYLYLSFYISCLHYDLGHGAL